MAKPLLRSNSSSFLAGRFPLIGGAILALLLLWALWFLVNPNPRSTVSTVSENLGESHCKGGTHSVNMTHDPPDLTYFDDPAFSYMVENPIENWDNKRREWLKHHPSFAGSASDRILLVSGQQPEPCKNPTGDHLLLRFFKNKVDYCRIHGYDIFYNNVLLHPKMSSFWAKLPVVRAAMIAHPEAEWIWWVDSDAVITDMEFKLPLEKYRDHNLVVHGWTQLIYEKQSWVSVNAGVFLIRNCQWSIDFMRVWASTGPQTPNYAQWGHTLKSIFKDKIFDESDDQSALIYFLYKEKEKWADKIYVESDYYFQGYWVGIVGTLKNISDKYLEIERGEHRLRRRHAEKVSEHYGSLREQYLTDAGYEDGSWRRPFVTHFTGCQPCSGNHNPMYTADACWKGMERALNFADDQVLRTYGYMHVNAEDLSSVNAMPFDFPARQNV